MQWNRLLEDRALGKNTRKPRSGQKDKSAFDQWCDERVAGKPARNITISPKPGWWTRYSTAQLIDGYVKIDAREFYGLPPFEGAHQI